VGAHGGRGERRGRDADYRVPGSDGAVGAGGGGGGCGSHPVARGWARGARDDVRPVVDPHGRGLHDRPRRAATLRAARDPRADAARAGRCLRSGATQLVEERRAATRLETALPQTASPSRLRSIATWPVALML